MLAWKPLCNHSVSLLSACSRPCGCEWDSGLEEVVREYDDRYVVEIAVPFASFPNGTPAVGSTWAGSVVRKRVRQGQDMGLARYQTWSPYVSAEIGFQRGLVFGKLDFAE